MDITSARNDESMLKQRNLILICIAAFLRSMSTGTLGVVLAVYLSRNGLTAAWIGVIIAAGLAGSAFATALVSYRVEMLGRRYSLVILSTLSAFGGIALLLFRSPAVLLAAAFIAMLNGMGTDRSAAFAIEQAAIPSLVADANRTWALSWYNVVLDAGGALGALSGALPGVVPRISSVDIGSAYQWLFAAYTAVNLCAAGIYLFLSNDIEVRKGPAGPARDRAPAIAPEARRIVRRISALFALDAGGGGFLADALLAYWFFERFGMNEQGLGLLFFVIRILNATSHLGAAWLATRIGLVNTMVFTHLPSSLFLLAVPLAPSFPVAAALLLAREALVEMDVPTRQSYIAAMVQPHERIYASGITNLTRTLSWAVTSSAAGALMQYVAFSAPLVLGGGMKVVYDILLYRNFRHLKPPEER
jgi:MFS family permease